MFLRSDVSSISYGGLLGDPAHPEINDYEAEITPEGVIAKDISVWQPDPDGTGIGARVTYTYKVLRPLTAYFVKSFLTVARKEWVLRISPA
jgi:hypothetical protein